MKVPILQGKRIILRPLKVKDAPNYVRWFSDKEVMKYFNQGVWQIGLEDEKTAIRKLQRSKINMNWGIEVEGEHIGGTGFGFDKKAKTARWGIIIGEKDKWGQGYAAEAARLCAEYIFKKLKLERMDLLVEMGNEKAIKAYKKAGFRLEGVMRSNGHNKLLRRRIDSGIMSILRDEWKKY